MTDNWRP